MIAYAATAIWIGLAGHLFCLARWGKVLTDPDHYRRLHDEELLTVAWVRQLKLLPHRAHYPDHNVPLPVSSHD